MSEVPMGPRPAAATQTTKEVNQLPQSKKRSRKQELQPDEQSGQSESQVEPQAEQSEPQAEPQADQEKQAEQSDQEKQAEQSESQTEQSDQEKQADQDQKSEESEQPTVADVLTQREEAVRFHNERAGGGDVHEGELQNQLDSHNERTGDPSR